MTDVKNPLHLRRAKFLTEPIRSDQFGHQFGTARQHLAKFSY